jgi:hypothetical protein
MFDLNALPPRDLVVTALIGDDVITYDDVVDFHAVMAQGITGMDVTVRTDDERVPDILNVSLKIGRNAYELEVKPLGWWANGVLRMTFKFPENMDGVCMNWEEL